ncbi:hypothetical protein T10_10628 [Trichinella papuae]|uniref:Uncharacterized protein n=1 Tax=Trichinella papuae TaxID=268474 RepID=A0A0V1NAD6_9BILA|nr:hypothetical protein T10_10628 [Trichinella papuae]
MTPTPYVAVTCSQSTVSDSQSVGRDPLVGREQILSGSRKTLNYRLPENHYFCLVSHSTPMLWVLAYPQRRMNN